MWGKSLAALIWFSMSLAGHHQAKILPLSHQGYFQNYSVLKMANFVRIQFSFLMFSSLLGNILCPPCYQTPYPGNSELEAIMLMWYHTASVCALRVRGKTEKKGPLGRVYECNLGECNSNFLLQVFRFWEIFVTYISGSQLLQVAILDENNRRMTMLALNWLLQCSIINTWSVVRAVKGHSSQSKAAKMI